MIPNMTPNMTPDRRSFRGWLADMSERSLARTTIARRVSALRSYYRFCGRTGRINVPDLAWLRAPKIPHAVPKPVSQEEARAMLQAIFQRRGDDWAKKRDFALLMLLYGAGLRISEALALTRAALPIGDWLRITGKGGKIREVPVLAAVAEAVADYVAFCPFDDGGDAPLFVSARGNALGARAAQRRRRKRTQSNTDFIIKSLSSNFLKGIQTRGMCTTMRLSKGRADTADTTATAGRPPATVTAWLRYSHSVERRISECYQTIFRPGNMPITTDGIDDCQQFLAHFVPNT